MWTAGREREEFAEAQSNSILRAMCGSPESTVAFTYTTAWCSRVQEGLVEVCKTIATWDMGGSRAIRIWYQLFYRLQCSTVCTLWIRAQTETEALERRAGESSEHGHGKLALARWEFAGVPNETKLSRTNAIYLSGWISLDPVISQHYKATVYVDERIDDS